MFAFLRFASGVVAHMHVSWLDPHKTRSITVVGSDKMAVFDDMEPDEKVTIFDKGLAERPETWRLPGPAVGRHPHPRIPADEPLRREARASWRLAEGRATRSRRLARGSP